jgi:hypothetical protein
VFYNILDEEEDTKRILGAVLPTYQQVNVGRQKPVKVGIRTGLPPWMITAPKNSLEVPFEQDVADMFYRN